MVSAIEISLPPKIPHKIVFALSNLSDPFMSIFPELYANASAPKLKSSLFSFLFGYEAIIWFFSLSKTSSICLSEKYSN